jgi:glycosyltransferase involved in cell wall biosynthesis
MGDLLISVCIPTYNNVKNLQRVIDSVDMQSFTSYEIIVSDDSTTCDVRELIQLNIQNGVAIRYYHHPISLGSPKNWNFAIQQAKGKYIKILHHDDWLLTSDALSLYYAEVSKAEKKFVFAAAESIQNGILFHHVPSKTMHQDLHANPFIILKANFIGGPSSILFPNDQLFFDERLIWLVDVDFYLQLFIKKYSANYISKQLYCTFMDDSNITNRCVNDYDLNIKELSIIYYKYKKTLRLIKRIQLLVFMYHYLRQVHKTNFVKSSFKILFYKP